MDCVLPVTGSDPLLLVLLGVLLLGTGVALVLGVRRRGVGGGAAVIVALALASAALVVSDARGADAQDCPPATTVAPTAAPTTTAATTTAAAAATTSSSTTTTVAATTTTVAGGGVPTNPTFPTTTAATTTTTVAAPDLTPSVRGLQTVFLGEGPWAYTIDVDNIGTVPTDGTTMTFTVSFPFAAVGFPGGLIDVVIDTSSASWTMSEAPGTAGSPGSPGTPTRVTFTSTPGFVIQAGADSNVILVVDFTGQDVADFSVDVALLNGIGGETNGTNNTASYPVDIRRRPPG